MILLVIIFIFIIVGYITKKYIINSNTSNINIDDYINT